MPFDWQTTSAVLIVAFAAWHLIRTFIPGSHRATSGCGGCQGCSERRPQLYQLDRSDY